MVETILYESAQYKELFNVSLEFFMISSREYCSSLAILYPLPVSRVHIIIFIIKYLYLIKYIFIEKIDQSIQLSFLHYRSVLFICLYFVKVFCIYILVNGEKISPMLFQWNTVLIERNHIVPAACSSQLRLSQLCSNSHELTIQYS